MAPRRHYVPKNKRPGHKRRSVIDDDANAPLPDYAFSETSAGPPLVASDLVVAAAARARLHTDAPFHGDDTVTPAASLLADLGHLCAAVATPLPSEAAGPNGVALTLAAALVAVPGVLAVSKQRSIRIPVTGRSLLPSAVLHVASTCRLPFQAKLSPAGLSLSPKSSPKPLLGRVPTCTRAWYRLNIESLPAAFSTESACPTTADLLTSAAVLPLLSSARSAPTTVRTPAAAPLRAPAEERNLAAVYCSEA
eukprot:gnl/Ergobibamus_cyprinoides/3546.p1 GENE.gnl/Ergobibamus_cyprinoides/3546~~gnl/Ergobibamus_cyprinoides/3546.p1  ORF type:complete len:251 (+),score=33.79 gnl/Ergobibamus_cyprinoides/3546:38-790(+)